MAHIKLQRLSDKCVNAATSGQRDDLDLVRVHAGDVERLRSDGASGPQKRYTNLAHRVTPITLNAYGATMIMKQATTLTKKSESLRSSKPP